MDGPLLYFQGFHDSGAMFQYSNNSLIHSTYLALFRTYLVTILKALAVLSSVPSYLCNKQTKNYLINYHTQFKADSELCI